MDGILVLAKPRGPTSHDMVALVRRLSGTRRVGHGGTLDPFATGVLPIFLGKATRVVEFHLGATKRYRATVCFGASSTTDDLEGELTPVEGSAPDRATVEATLEAFRGEIQQRPPSYSAINVAGRRAYAIARSGETPELAPRTVVVHELSLVEWDDRDPARPVAIVDVTCSAGTYIRAIARDLGRSVGSAAYLGALARTASGSFSVAHALSVEVVREAAAAGEDAFRAVLLPVDEGLGALPVLRITPAEREAITRGQFVRPAGGIPAGLAQEAMLRLVDDAGLLVALGRVRGPRVAPEKVLVDIGPQQGSRGVPAHEAVQDPDEEPAAPGRRHRTDIVAAPGTRLVAGLDALTADDGPLLVVVGVFDGLHRGHAHLLDQLRREANGRGAKPAVITFDAHPDEILLGSAPPILCDPDERLVRLAAAGIEVTVVQHFDRALRMTSYQGFVAMITRRTTLAGLLMTPEAAFGHERRGTPDALAVLGREQGFEVIVVPPFQIAGREVRSADIRELIVVGDLVGAAALLGRPYAFVGERAAAKEGNLADARQEVLTFRLPVALPPAGQHRGFVEAAWEPARGSELPHGASVAGPGNGPVYPAEIVIPREPGWVEVRSTVALPEAARLRVTLAS
jgi:tRNA pseudouridine55 synthase